MFSGFSKLAVSVRVETSAYLRASEPSVSFPDQTEQK